MAPISQGERHWLVFANCHLKSFDSFQIKFNFCQFRIKKKNTNKIFTLLKLLIFVQKKSQFDLFFSIKVNIVAKFIIAFLKSQDEMTVKWTNQSLLHLNLKKNVVIKIFNIFLFPNCLIILKYKKSIFKLQKKKKNQN